MTKIFVSLAQFKELCERTQEYQVTELYSTAAYRCVDFVTNYCTQLLIVRLI